MLKLIGLVTLFALLQIFSGCAGESTTPDPSTNGMSIENISNQLNLTNSKLTGELIYIPDRNGNFYWHNTSEIRPNVYQIKIIKYFLYTRKNKEEGEGQRIFINYKENVTNSNFNPDHPTRVLIHGFFNDGNSYFGQKVKDAYLQRGEYNVIVVDWGSVAEDWNYLEAK